MRIIDATNPLPLVARPQPEGEGGSDAARPGRGGSMVGWGLVGAPLIREAADACGAGEIHLQGREWEGREGGGREGKDK